MTDENAKNEEEAANQPQAGAGEQGAPEGFQEPPREGFADPLEFLNAELERSEGEKADLQDKLMRLAAEMENLRKRTARDVADAREYSIAGFAREMLGVSDNLRRALDAVPAEMRDAGDAVFKALVEGVELTERTMLQGLEKGGVKKISPKGERFDPNFHQAMFEIPNTEIANNTVLEVVQDGYVIGERMLRPAMVGVSKGGPKQAAPADAPEDEAGPASTGDAETA